MKQISIVSDAHPNAIAEMIEALGAAGVNIETLDSEVQGDTLVAILTVDRYDEALRALARADFNAVSEEAILIRIEDRPGAMASIAHRFREAGIDLRSVRIIRRAEGQGIVALATARTEESIALVRDVLLA